jgi:hypothetical protein
MIYHHLEINMNDRKSKVRHEILVRAGETGTLGPELAVGT